MSILSVRRQKRVTPAVSEESAVAPAITLSERSSTGLGLLCIGVLLGAISMQWQGQHGSR